jgi:hypothetical protein
MNRAALSLMVFVTKPCFQALLVLVVLAGCWLSNAIGEEQTSLEELQWLAGYWVGSAGGIAMAGESRAREWEWRLRD